MMEKSLKVQTGDYIASVLAEIEFTRLKITNKHRNGYIYTEGIPQLVNPKTSVIAHKVIKQRGQREGGREKEEGRNKVLTPKHFPSPTPKKKKRGEGCTHRQITKKRKLKFTAATS